MLCVMCISYEYLWLYNFITFYNYYRLEVGILSPTSFHASHGKERSWLQLPQGDDASAARQRFDQLCSERRSQVEAW